MILDIKNWDDFQKIWMIANVQKFFLEKEDGYEVYINHGSSLLRHFIPKTQVEFDLIKETILQGAIEITNVSSNAETPEEPEFIDYFEDY